MENEVYFILFESQPCRTIKRDIKKFCEGVKCKIISILDL
jgi:hypothetical protein